MTHNYFTGFIALVVLAFILVYWQDTKTIEKNAIAQYKLEQSIHTMQHNDSVRKTEVAALREGRRLDSIRTSSIENLVHRSPGMVTAIKDKYADKKHHIDTLSFDKQLSIFSDNLSKSN